MKPLSVKNQPVPAHWCPRRVRVSSALAAAWWRKVVSVSWAHLHSGALWLTWNYLTSSCLCLLLFDLGVITLLLRSVGESSQAMFPNVSCGRVFMPGWKSSRSTKELEILPEAVNFIGTSPEVVWTLEHQRVFSTYWPFFPALYVDERIWSSKQSWQNVLICSILQKRKLRHRGIKSAQGHSF